jgi:hypothetical protein
VRPLVVAASLVVLTGAVVGGACDAGLVHTFGAFPYNTSQNCLEAATPLDVIDGPDPGSCPVVHCWVNPVGEVFVSDMACDAPLDFKESASGPCELALEAYKKRVMCGDAGASGGGGAGGS